MPTDCPSDSTLKAFATLGPVRATDAALLAHLMDCAGCQSRVDGLAATLDLPTPPPPALATSDAASAEADEYRSLAHRIVRGLRGALENGQGFGAGRYRVKGSLGVGGMGEVFEAVDTRLGRRVAIKTIRGEHFSPDTLKRLEAEASALADLAHPGIVRVHEWGTHRGLPFLAMEFIDGETLSARLRRGPLAPADAARLARQVALALEHVHASGLLHRDLKPSNLILEPAGQPATGDSVDDAREGKSWRPRLIDFGLTKRLEGAGEMSRTGGLLGTPAYMSPEQAGDKIDLLGPRSDLYSLGAVLYQCLTGQPPFPSDSEANTLQMIRHVDPPHPRLFNRRIPRDLETICLKCLRKEPAGRYPSAAALADDLGRFLASKPILARPAGPVERLWSWARRNRRLAAALAGLALALLVLVGVLGVYGWREARLHRLAEDEAARANALVGENARVYARTANDMAMAASSLALTAGNFQDQRILGHYQNLQAAYSQLLENFAGNPSLADRYPETLAEMCFHQGRMCENLGDRIGAAAADKRMLLELRKVANPTDASLEWQVTVVVRLASDAVAAKRPDEAVDLLRSVWDQSRQLPPQRFQPGTPRWHLVENVAHFLSGILANELKDNPGADTVQRQLAELKEKVQAQAKGPG